MMSEFEAKPETRRSPTLIAIAMAGLLAVAAGIYLIGSGERISQGHGCDEPRSLSRQLRSKPRSASGHRASRFGSRRPRGQRNRPHARACRLVLARSLGAHPGGDCRDRPGIVKVTLIASTQPAP